MELSRPLSLPTQCEEAAVARGGAVETEHPVRGGPLGGEGGASALGSVSSNQRSAARHHRAPSSPSWPAIVRRLPGLCPTLFRTSSRQLCDVQDIRNLSLLYKRGAESTATTTAVPNLNGASVPSFAARTGSDSTGESNESCVSVRADA